MKSKSEDIKFPEIAKEINTMAKVDQDMRKKQIDTPEFWDSSVDIKNTKCIKEIISQIGWPTISKVGKESSRNAWLLVQHADHDTEFQKHCLQIIKKEPRGEVNLENIALLEDRVRVHAGQLQLYATQYKKVNGKFVPINGIEDPKHLEERRKVMGLDTLPKYLKGLAKLYKIN